MSLMSDRDEPFDKTSEDPEETEPPPAPTARWSFILTLWMETADADPSLPPHLSVWRGCVETPARQRTYFGSMARLNEYLVAATGWEEPPGQARE